MIISWGREKCRGAWRLFHSESTIDLRMEMQVGASQITVWFCTRPYRSQARGSRPASCPIHQRFVCRLTGPGSTP